MKGLRIFYTISLLVVVLLNSCVHMSSGRNDNKFENFEYKELFGRIIITNYVGSEKDIRLV
jgi:hypothetical protein